MKFKSLILLVISLFILFSCDDGIKFDNPNDRNSDAYNPSDTEGETDSDSDETDNPSETDNDKPISDDADSIDDSGDSVPDESDSDDDSADSVPNNDSDLIDPTPDESDSTPDEDSDTDSGDSTSDEDADTDSGDSTPDQDTDTDTTPATPCDPNPCSGIANSTEECSLTDSGYICGCDDGYFWNGSECHEQITLGNICTGQNRCYDNEKEIPCPIPASSDFYGQDAQYAKAGYCYPQSFTVKTVSGQNIVVDNNTGLEWQQVISEDTFTWDDAGSYCENLEYGGYSDWRLPTPHELLTIIDNNKHDPAADASYFSFSSDLWTSKSYVTDTNKAFKLGFAYGYVWFYDNKTSELQAMCVRGNELKEPNFSTSTTNSNVVVKDSVTGLMWQKDYVTSKNWQEALKYCEDLTYAGKSDWRLPNKNELAALLNFDNTSAPYSDFTDMPSKWFWTSTTSNKLESIHQAWHTNFSTKYGSNTESKNDSTSLSSNAVRCVRSEKINDPCNPNPCNGVANSTKTCTQHNAFEYSCGCNNGYFWNGSTCAVLPECSATSGTPCKDSTSGLIWSEKATETMPWQDAINYCNNDTEGGFSWHLPNIDELRTIFIASRTSACQLSETNNCISMSNCWSCETCMETGIASTSGNTCSNWGTSYSDGRYSKFGETGWFWSSSTESASSNNAFGISFNVGGISDYERSYNHDVRCVRCEDGYYWNGSTCAVLPECSKTSGTPCKDSTSGLTWSTKSTNTMNWQAAIDYCSTYSEGRLTGWHLPNIDELRTIIKDRKTAAGSECNVSETNNCLSQGSCWSFETCAEACNGSWDSCTTYNDGRFSKFGDTTWFFSSSTLTEDTNLAWRVGFSNGYIGTFNKSNSGNIRCAR